MSRWRSAPWLRMCWTSSRACQPPAGHEQGDRHHDEVHAGVVGARRAPREDRHDVDHEADNARDEDAERHRVALTETAPEHAQDESHDHDTAEAHAEEEREALP